MSMSDEPIYTADISCYSFNTTWVLRQHILTTVFCGVYSIRCIRLKSDTRMPVSGQKAGELTPLSTSKVGEIGTRLNNL